MKHYFSLYFHSYSLTWVNLLPLSSSWVFRSFISSPPQFNLKLGRPKLSLSGNYLLARSQHFYCLPGFLLAVYMASYLKHACLYLSSMHTFSSYISHSSPETPTTASNKAKINNQVCPPPPHPERLRTVGSLHIKKVVVFFSRCLMRPSVDLSLNPKRWKMSEGAVHMSEMKKRQKELNKEEDSYGGLQSVTPSTLWRVFLQTRVNN